MDGLGADPISTHETLDRYSGVPCLQLIDPGPDQLPIFPFNTWARGMENREMRNVVEESKSSLLERPTRGIISRSRDAGATGSLEWAVARA